MQTPQFPSTCFVHFTFPLPVVVSVHPSLTCFSHHTHTHTLSLSLSLSLWGHSTWRNAQFGEKVIIQMEEKSRQTASELKEAIG